MSIPVHEMGPLPHPSIEAAIPLLNDRIAAVSAAATPGSTGWNGLCDANAKGLFDLYTGAAGADEGTLWLFSPSDETLVPAYNNGPDAGTLLGGYRQPLSLGLISSVFVTQMGLCESWVYRNSQHDDSVNRMLGNVTAHMVVVPLFFGGEARGVISAVKLRRADQEDPPPFGMDGYEMISRLSQLLGEILHGRLLGTILGSRR
jgi:hypothetical protein